VARRGLSVPLTDLGEDVPRPPRHRGRGAGISVDDRGGEWRASGDDRFGRRSRDREPDRHRADQDERHEDGEERA
jgi:hypothetical protein